MQKGVALVLVLWMVALLAVIAGSMVFSLRTEVQVAGNLVDAARAEAAADAGVFKAIGELMQPATDAQRWQGNGVTHQWRFGDANLRITIMDEAGKIDINTASEALLKSLFRSVGADELQSESLADAVADWRDGDDFRRPRGAEKAEYLAAGLDYGPRNAGFQTIEELRLVLGVDQAIFLRVNSLATVHSGRPGVATEIASPKVLQALPGARPEDVEAYVKQREALLTQGLPVAAAPFAREFGSPPLGDTFQIQVEALLGDNTIFFREAVVRLTGNAKEPVVVLAWRSPATTRGARI